MFLPRRHGRILRKEYFKGVEDLAEGFADDNPLAGSASYEIYLKDIDMQDDMVAWLGTVQGIRKINYSSDTASGLSSFNKMLGLLSAVIIAILLAVAIFLISNTITTAAAFRREENRIMRLIGATNFMIRAPFVVQGVMIGLVGALIPLAITYFLYRQAVVYMMERFDILSNLIEFIDSDHFPEHGSRGDGAGRGNRFCRKFLYDPQTFKGVRNIGGCCGGSGNLR